MQPPPRNIERTRHTGIQLRVKYLNLYGLVTLSLRMLVILFLIRNKRNSEVHSFRSNEFHKNYTEVTLITFAHIIK